MSGETAQLVIQGLAKVGLAMKHMAWQYAGPRGLNPTQAQVLAILRARGELPIGTGEVARQLAVTAATASDSIRVLVDKGFVEKARSPVDARAVILRLTPAGRAEAERSMGWPDFLSAAVDALSAEEQRVFVRSLVKMVRSLQEAGRIPVSRMCTSCRFFRPHVYADLEQPHHCAFTDSPFGDAALRFDCAEQQPADEPARLWELFVNGKPAAGLRAGETTKGDSK
jgi:DNA-binding MarR family transcriptional regulator